MAAHAILSASGSKRFIACPGSIPLTAKLPESQRNNSSTAADQGTAAHALGERCLLEGHESSTHYLGWTIQYEDGMESEVWYEPGKAPQASGFYPVDHDMTYAVDVYLGVIREMLAECDGAELFVERRFSLEWLRPGMFGTSDATIYQFLGLLRVVDYKHGQGVPVEVEGNTQGLYYALGMAQEVDWLFEEVEVVIVQPRCPHQDGPVRRWRISKDELRQFADKLGAAADRVEEARDALSNCQDETEYLDWAGTYLEAGHEQCQFCPAKATCPGALWKAQEVALADFSDDPQALELSLDELDPSSLDRLRQVLEWAPFLDGLVKAAKTLGDRRLKQGLPVPGYKLVQGKANRVWAVDEAAVVEAATAAGVDKEALYSEPKLLGPAKIEKLDKELKKLVAGVKVPKAKKKDPDGPDEWEKAPLAVKGVGKITMAPDSDPRPAVPWDPTADFEDDLPEEDVAE
jgi:hypothetical protein